MPTCTKIFSSQYFSHGSSLQTSSLDQKKKLPTPMTRTVIMTILIHLKSNPMPQDGLPVRVWVLANLEIIFFRNSNTKILWSYLYLISYRHDVTLPLKPSHVKHMLWLMEPPNLWDLSSFLEYLMSILGSFPYTLQELSRRCKEKTDFAGELPSVCEKVMLPSLNGASSKLKNCPKMVFAAGITSLALLFLCVSAKYRVCVNDDDDKIYPTSAV